MTFADLGLSDSLVRAVTDAGYDIPTPIQKGVIPAALMGKDLVGIAQTGTGKTAGFVLPMIDILSEGRTRARMPRSLILEPTRELAAQALVDWLATDPTHSGDPDFVIMGDLNSYAMEDPIDAIKAGADDDAGTA